MKYVYMLGIDNDDWTVQDTKVCKKYDIKVKGYYEIGGIEGMVLVGELENLEDLMEMYFGLEIVEDYLYTEDEFDFEDGRWISGSWKESKKSCGKSLKERSEENEIIVSELQDTVEYFCGLYEEDKELKGRALESLKNAVERLEVFNAIGSIYQWGVEVLNKCGIKYKGLKESKKSLKESQEYNFDYFYQLLKDDKHFSVNYAHDDLPDDNTVYANGDVDVKWFIDGKRLNHSAILSIPCFSMVFTSYEGLLFNCEHGSRYNSVIGYADISDVRFTSDLLSLLLVNGLRITFNLY